jgi:hypothetical protein
MENSTHPVLKASWVISQLREKEDSSEQSEARIFWPLLERPVLVAWKVILEGASEFLEKSWAENVIAPTTGLSRVEQLNLLYGPQGKVREFVNQFVSPFLVENESRPGRMLGKPVPFPASILTAVQEAKQLGPIFELKTPHRVRVEAARPSVLDSQTYIVEERTEFALECAAKTYTTNNRPKDPSEASTVVFWSADTCGDVVITVSMSCGRSCVERAAAVGIAVPEAASLRLIKRYTGQTGFLQFIRDFRNGSRTFGETELADAEDALRRYRISSVKVSYQLDVPDTLWKLASLILK